MVVLTAIAAAFGWAIGRQHDDRIVAAEPSTSSEQERSVGPAPLTAFTPEAPIVVAVPPDVRTRDQAYEPEVDAAAPIDADRLANALAVGTDRERRAALTTALQHDVELPPDVLVNVFHNDTSDEVRLLAFTIYIDSQSDDVELVRAALQSATNNSSPVVQAEAHRRLTELTNYEQALAAAPRQEMP